MPPGTPLPHLPTAAEQITHFGQPVAMLADPPEGSRLLLGTQGVDGFTHRVDILYTVDRAHLLQVSTVRPHPRTLTRLGDALESFVVNAEEKPPGTSPRDWYERWYFVRELPPSTTSLRLDGADRTGLRISFDGYFGIETAIEETQVMVCGRTFAEPLLGDLLTGTELRGREFRPRGLTG